MKPSTALVLAGVTLALAACNRPDQNRTTSVPPGVHNPTALVEPIVTPSAPPAPAERGPIPPRANADAPGTNASLAFSDAPKSGAKAPLTPSKDGGPDLQALAVSAQDAAAKAPDTAAADAAKEAVIAEGTNAPAGDATARDSAANNPRHGTLTPSQEDSQMPKAGQVNNHSSTALEKNSGR
jgi:hypothetical protein